MADTETKRTRKENPINQEGGDLSILGFIRQNSILKSFAEAAHSAEVEELLKNQDPLTVLIPVEEGLARLPRNLLPSLSMERLRLRKVLKNHIIPDRVSREDIRDMGIVRTLDGGFLSVTLEGDKTWLDDAEIIDADILCSNGIVHLIDGLLWPAFQSEQRLERTPSPAKALGNKKKNE
jgi:uncharacterized surface protein with fasciclin (FAS1) repeats